MRLPSPRLEIPLNVGSAHLVTGEPTQHPLIDPLFFQSDRTVEDHLTLLYLKKKPLPSLSVRFLIADFNNNFVYGGIYL